MAIKFSDITGGGIQFGNNAARPASPGIGKLYSNGEAARLELYTATGWQNIVQEVPGVASITGTYSEQTNSGTITIAGTNFVNGAIASAIGTNGVEVIASSTTYNSLVQLTAVFTGLSNINEPYDIKVTNPSNLFGMIPDALYVNASPVWTTAAGSLGTFNEQVSVSISATATDSDSTITYALASGSTLPSGISLNSSTGLISGTLPNITSNTTYSFTINTSDGLNIIPRAFSINSLVVSAVSGGILASDATYYYRVFKSNDSLVVADKALSVDALIIAGGGGGGTDLGGGGGAGGVLYSSGISLNPASYPIVVGLGGNGGYMTTPSSNLRGTVQVVGLNGANSTFNSLTAIGGGGAAGYADNGDSVRSKIAQNGGSGGGGGSSGTGSNPGGLGNSGQGSNGGAGSVGSSYGGGGGGGSGGSGGIGTGTNGGTGGIGINSYSAWLSAISSVMSDVSGWSTATSGGRIAGGGGGGLYTASSATSTNGQGTAGGGSGGHVGNQNGYNGIANTGGGGGGAGYNGGDAINAGAGGSGIVIIRYLKTAV